MGVSIIKTFPDICNIKCLCYSCGCQDFPNLMNDWWCDGFCLCCYNQCGLKELMETQYCCLGPCSKPEFKTTFSFPEICTINCCCSKQGIKMPEGCDVIQKSTCFCLHSECGLKDLFSRCQYFCIEVKC